LLASVLHLFIAFVIAAIAATIYFSRTFFRLTASRILITFFLVISVYTVYKIQPKNFALITYYTDKIFSLESPKTLVTVNSVSKLPRNSRGIFIASVQVNIHRAGLIGSGKYFGDFTNPRKFPLLQPATSKAFAEYTYPEWERVARFSAIRQLNNVKAFLLPAFDPY